MDKICRVCMKPETELHLIFDEEYGLDSISLAEIITECTIYKVSRYDGLPQQICDVCTELARNAFNFKRNYEKTHRQLIGMLNGYSCGTQNILSFASSKIKLENDALPLDKSTQTLNSTLHTCERCEQKFYTLNALSTHKEAEHKVNAIVCRFCSKSFNRIGYLNTHVAVSHPECGHTMRNQCSICQRQFTQREHMRRHLAVMHKAAEIADMPEISNDASESLMGLGAELEEELSNPPYQRQLEELEKDIETDILPNYTSIYSNPTSSAESEVAALVSGGSSSAKQRTLSDEEDDKPLSDLINARNGSFVEVLLEESANIECDLNATEVDGGDIKREFCNSPIGESNEDFHYKCTTCNKVFRRQTTLRRHRLNHSAEKPLECQMCGKSFTRTDFLNSHMKRIHNAAKCSECDINFKHINDYKRHKESTHASKMYACEVCQKNFSTKLYMQRHLASHGQKRFTCRECAERFLSKEQLKAHVKAEGHDKTLLCPECGLRCKTSNVLMVHMRRHKGEKPFKCKFCSKGFPRMDDLRIHEKYHTGEKSYFCETCGKGFQRKYNLTIHMRVHTGEKPYQCPHCPHAFTQSNDLKAHIRRHTGERFRCEYCGAAFLQGYRMRQHKFTEHGVKEEPPTQRVEKFTSLEEQEQQIKQNLQRELAKSIHSTAEESTLDTFAIQTNINSNITSNNNNNEAFVAPANTQMDMNFLNIL